MSGSSLIDRKIPAFPLTGLLRAVREQPVDVDENSPHFSFFEQQQRVSGLRQPSPFLHTKIITCSTTTSISPCRLPPQLHRPRTHCDLRALDRATQTGHPASHPAIVLPTTPHKFVACVAPQDLLGISNFGTETHDRREREREYEGGSCLVAGGDILSPRGPRS